MGEQLTKLRPDRDLQCYFFQPSAVAALSNASEHGFRVSGSWRQQFDWVVLEWNRDNVFEHPTLRNLPDGDLSGVHLSYEETRSNCIPLDSTLYPTVDWPYLRVWAVTASGEVIYRVPISRYATPVGGEYAPATATFELQGTITSGDYIELAWLDQHFNYLVTYLDTPASAVAALASVITANHETCSVTATASGNQITLTYLGMPGTNGNRVGVYGTVHGASMENWVPASATFAGGTSPERWRVDLPFSDLYDVDGVAVPMSNVRKLRWTWAADLQPADFIRSDFFVEVTNWNVSGSNLLYQVAGPGSNRIEDDSSSVTYTGPWSTARGNYSGSSIQWTTTPGATMRCSYSATTAHQLYLGTRFEENGAPVVVQVDGKAPVTIDLRWAGEDVLARVPLGLFAGPAQHTVTVIHAGTAGTAFYFDFVDVVIPAAELPEFDPVPQTSVATDWDTLHSLAIAPERTAWLIHTLGFHGRVNHYAGALWFYELRQQKTTYATGTITFTGTTEFGMTTQILLGPTSLEHRNLIGDTAITVAKCFELLINAGATGVWAKADDATLTVRSRIVGDGGNGLTLRAATNSGVFQAETSGALAGGESTKWITDLSALPPINRAARDWSSAFYRALKGYGLDVTAAFSMELGNGDDTEEAAIAQRYPDGSATWLNTPALQTNFGPASTTFWRAVYSEMADVMAQADVPPYLQFGEVQWWYFAAPSGMPFYDAYTKARFVAEYGREMGTVVSEHADPVPFASECALLPKLIGEFTSAVTSGVRERQPAARFEVLYPPDVNDTPLNRIINYPRDQWTPTNLASLKTENFTFTGDRNLDKARESIDLPAQLGFAPSMQPPGGHRRRNSAMGKGTATGCCCGPGIRGAVRFGSVLPYRVRSAAGREHRALKRDGHLEARRLRRLFRAPGIRTLPRSETSTRLHYRRD